MDLQTRMVLCVAGFPEHDARKPLLRHYIALPPMSSARPPHSRVLVPPAKRGDPAPTANAISLRYQPMSIADPTRHAPPAMASSRHRSPPARPFRPKTAPGPRHTPEAVPHSWASASRPSDLRPNPPAPHPPRAPRPSPTPPPPPPPPSQPARLRSKSAERVATKTSVSGPRSPKRAAALVQPTPKRLSLGMAMDTAKLVSAPPPSSDLGSSPASLPLSKPLPTNTVPIRSLPASPNGSPCISRLPISGSHYKRDVSPSPVPPIHRATSPASPPALGPKPLPVPPLPPSPRRPMLHLNPTVPLSPLAPSSWSPKSHLQTSPSTSTTTGTTSPYLSALPSDDSSPVKRDSPASTWSSGYFTSPCSPQNDRCRDGHQIHASLPSPHLPPSQPIQEVEEEEEEERQDYLDNFDAYDWTLEEELYDDQLFRIPVPPTAPESDNLPLEVFVDNLYCGELERSPSPITYARPAGSDFSDEETHGGRRRRARRRAHVQQEEEERTTPKRVGHNTSGVSASLTGNRRHSRRSDPSSPISYHSDDSSLYLTGNRPVPSRRRRREQLRSYRYSFRPPVSPTAAAAATAVSLNTLAGFPRKVVRSDGGGKALPVALGCQRSPSPIEYARRRSLDGLYGLDSEDEVDEDESEVVFAHPPPVGAGDGLVLGWGESSGLEFLDDDGGRRKFASGGGGGKGRMVQPRSFMHAYSRPPDVASFSGERKRVLEKERGRRKERTLVPMPLGGYSHTYGNNSSNSKERSKEKEKPRTRKGSRGFLDELAAVAVRNTQSNRKTNNYNVNNGIGTPRTSGGSPPPPPILPSLPPLPFHSRDEKDKEKEKEKKRRWVWELSKSDGSSSRDKLVVGSGNGSSSTLEGESGEGVLVLDIGNVNANAGVNAGVNGNGPLCGEGYEGWNAVWPGEEDERCGGAGYWRGRSKRHSLNGLEFV